MTTLTEAEREMLRELLGSSILSYDENETVCDRLAREGLIEVDEAKSTSNFVYWMISDEGAAALMEADIAERFKEFNDILCHPHANMRGLIACLAEHVRDQERRLWTIEHGRAIP